VKCRFEAGFLFDDFCYNRSTLCLMNCATKNACISTIDLSKAAHIGWTDVITVAAEMRRIVERLDRDGHSAKTEIIKLWLSP